MTAALLLFALAVLALSFAALASPVAPTPVIVENTSAAPAAGPVSAGVPFPKGALAELSSLALSDPKGAAVALQAQTLSKWLDGSCRWVLLDFSAAAPASGAATYTLSASGIRPSPASPVAVDETGSAVTISNGLVAFTVSVGSAGGTLKTSDSKSSAPIVSTVEIAGATRVTSKVVIDRVEVYARGPVRAALDLTGRRIYSDGIEGPFSQRVEIFAGSAYVRVEDTFIYAHFPGTHAAPQNALALWQVSAKPADASAASDLVPLAAPEESEGLVVSPSAVAFYGLAKPFDLSRYSDEDNVGEDCPGAALGVAKSCAVLVGFPRNASDKSAARASAALYAHTTPAVYASSGAFGKFYPETAGRFGEIEEGLRQILGYWLWFQDHDPKGVDSKGAWHGLFDWGDWQTRYADRRGRPTGWNYLEGRYGWDCNEMDTTLTLWSAFLHSARAEYWRAAVAMSRHMMDVDVINVDYRKYSLPDYLYDPHHYGAPWKEGQDRLRELNTIGLGRRHNVQHWGNGVGDTRHTWNGGLIMYYYLTGNRRAWRSAINMAEMHMQRITGYASGEYCLSLWCLHNAFQLTGDARYLAEFKYRLGVVHALRLPDGSIPEHLDFDKKADYPDVDHGRGGYLDLTLDYISNALIDYHNDTADPIARDVLLGLAERNMKDRPSDPGDYRRIDGVRILAWAYRETGHKKFLKRAKYHLDSVAAQPLPRKPKSADELLELTEALLHQFHWDIRVVGPMVRMAPYVLSALTESGM